MAFVTLSDALNDPLNVAKTIKCSAETPIEFTDTVWDDLRGPANGINPVGSPSPATPNTADGSLTFAKGNVCAVWFQLPHKYKHGTDLHPHIHWSKATSAAGLVNWQMKYKWANRAEVMPAYSVMIPGSDLVPCEDTANLHAMLGFGELDGTDKTISSMIGLYIERVSSGDTYSGNANLYEVDIHFEIDTVGSKEIATK
jgi:hypothetical protein